MAFLEFENVGKVYQMGQVQIDALHDTSFTVEAEIAVSPTFYSWVFNYGGKIQILEPPSIKNEYQTRLKEAYNGI